MSNDAATPSILSRPLSLRSGATLPNRLVKAAMSEVLADPATGAPTDRLVRLYERWGRGGAGALITGHVIVDRGGLGEPGNVVIEDERHLPALRRWAEVGQAHGARMWMQINHAGRQTPRRVVRQPVAPSPVALRGFGGMFARPRALSGDEILALIGRFASAAAVARDAGFAGVQVHAAHGYLLSQFLSPLTNQREDEWGGALAGRMRFLVETVRAIRAAVGPGFGVGVKLNSADFQRGGFTAEEAMQVAQALDSAGIDLLEVTGGNYESPAMTGTGELPAEQRQSSREREAYFMEYAQRIRAVTEVPILLTGGMRTAATMAAALSSGAVDAVGLARPMAFDPDLPARLLAGDESARSVRIRSRLRIIDNMLQVFWYQAQIHRMGDGHEPAPALGRWTALWHGLRNSMLAPAPRQRAQAALAPAATAGG
ncbi:MAG TPA: NADH:flavin oxidoreductase/NADH oxidase family protein [Haliangium sp.]|nr:NADH:flavin oxidoreductase/NADH oxidase family protein [Haliangium sp.]